MREEIITRKQTMRCLNITASKIDSLRINDLSETTVRVYDGGKIGIAGKQGNCDIEELKKEALKNLETGVPYPDIPSPAGKEHADNMKNIISEKEFVPAMKKLLARIERENPEFSFSNKIKYIESEKTYLSGETDYSYKGNELYFSIAIKYKGTSNIMDEAFEADVDYYDEDEIAGDIKTICDAFLKKAALPKEDEAIFAVDGNGLTLVIRHFLADYYYNHLSLFDGKLGEKIFADNLNVVLDRSDNNLNIPFFDAEGLVAENKKLPLIENGVFKNLILTKRNAAQYSAAANGSAGSEYDSVPSVTIAGFTVVPEKENVSDIVGDKEIIYVTLTSGGDVTADGTLSLPVQASYAMKNNKLSGKLPSYALTVNVKDLLSDGFLGAAKNCAYPSKYSSYIVFKAKIVNREE